MARNFRLGFRPLHHCGRLRTKPVFSIDGMLCIFTFGKGQSKISSLFFAEHRAAFGAHLLFGDAWFQPGDIFRANLQLDFPWR